MNQGDDQTYLNLIELRVFSNDSIKHLKNTTTTKSLEGGGLGTCHKLTVDCASTGVARPSRRRFMEPSTRWQGNIVRGNETLKLTLKES